MVFLKQRSSSPQGRENTYWEYKNRTWLLECCWNITRSAYCVMDDEGYSQALKLAIKLEHFQEWNINLRRAYLLTSLLTQTNDQNLAETTHKVILRWPIWNHLIIKVNIVGYGYRGKSKGKSSMSLNCNLLFKQGCWKFKYLPKELLTCSRSYHVSNSILNIKSNHSNHSGNSSA